MIARRYFRDLRQFGGGRLVLLGGLTLAGALTDGIGLLLLVPLLELVGAGQGSGLSRSIGNVLDGVGLDLTLGSVLGVYVVLVAVRGALVRTRAVATARFQFEFVDWQRLRLFESIARADWRYQVTRRNSDVTHSVMSDIGRVGQGTNLVLQASTRAAMAVAYVAVAVRLSPALTAVAAAASVALSGLLWPLVRRSRDLGAHQSVTGRRAFGSMSDLLDGMKLAKVHGTEEAHLEEFRSAVVDLRSAQVGFQRTQALASFAYDLATAVALASIVFVGHQVVEVGTAQLLALIVVMSRILPVAGSVASDVRGAVNMLPAYEQAMATIDEATEHAERPVVSARPHPLETSIEVDAVTLTYPDAGRPAIDAVTLRLPARTTTALVGPSGAGKTTLADVVLGLLIPDEGEVRVDGLALTDIDLGAWRACISYVPQEPFLFHDTLRANVQWATAGLTDAEIIDLLGVVGLSSLLDQLPEGLSTVVGDRGHRLSGGERQRVVLARALARRPRLLVLDEATSHLDAESELAAREAIDALQGELTVLVIAHRLGTVRNADRIVVLADGRVLDEGTWAELEARPGPFREMLLVGGT